MSANNSNARPAPDQVLIDIADYVSDYEISNHETYRAARYCLMDAIGCAVEAVNFPDCAKLLGPMIPGIIFPHGARVPGTQFELDPVSAAFNIGTMVRWLEFNDVFTGAVEGGHPSDNLGGILATADYLSRKHVAARKSPLVMREVLTALIKAYEIQGVLAMENGFTRLGFDHVTLTKVAATAVVTQMLGGGREEIVNAIANAWADGVSLKIYRQGNNTVARKNWAGGDATSRAVWLGLIALKGELGCPSVLTAKTFGFYDAFFQSQPFKFLRPYGCYVMEHVAMFKFVPAGNPAQTAVECAFRLHPLVKDRLDDIAAITIRTQRRLMNIMDKQGPLTNPSDRDHCAQYVIAVGLIYGKLNTSDFEDEFASDPRIDRLRAKMTVVEEPRYSGEHLNAEQRSKANAIEVRFKDGSSTPKVEVEHALGHPRRRAEGIPMVEAKFKTHIARRFPRKQQAAILDLCMDQARLEATPVNEFLNRFVI